MSASVQAVMPVVETEGVIVTEGGFVGGAAPVVYSAPAPVYYTGTSASVAAPQMVAPAAPVYITAEGEAPVVYSSAGYSASVPVTYGAPTVAYTTAPTYSYGAPVSVIAEATPAAGVYVPGARITYESKTTGKVFPGFVVDMYTDGGCQVQLDVDGGVKDLYLEDMWRVKPEGVEAPAATTETTTTTTTTKKSKKAKKSSKKKGCC